MLVCVCCACDGMCAVRFYYDCLCLFVVVCEFQSVFVLRNMCDLCVMYRGMLHDLCFVSFACVCECLCVSVCVF